MGEIADMMLDGTLCQGCCTYLGDDDGYPVYCGECQGDLGVDGHGSKPEKVPCPHCKKKVKVAGLQMHIKAVHNI